MTRIITTKEIQHNAIITIPVKTRSRLSLSTALFYCPHTLKLHGNSKKRKHLQWYQNKN